MAEFRIETQRLVLRDWREEDWRPFFEGTNTPAVMRWLGGVMNEDRQVRQRGRLESYARDHGHTFWVIILKDSAAVIGFCGIKLANLPGGPQGDFEVGWRLCEDAWGMGYAKEAAQASLKHAFTQLGAPHVIALTVPANTASWGLMQRLGMERHPEMDFIDFESNPEDGRVIAYRLERAMWENRHV
ncbi:MAG: GNAT family N-acetyltransferase [Novosphingobium sp.]|jgi:RimJ/RimL family protein N-acetyltransferase